jgi:CRP/FNR family transcriptional regulator, cyclic AMP receptor protein
MDFLKSIEWPMWFGFAAVAASIVTCAMKTMIPLRIVSMVCNSLFIIYGFFGAVYPTLLLNLILLPLNSLRLQQMQKLIRDVEAAASYGDTSIDWLKPFMSHRSFRKGEIVFRKGDVADAMFYSVSGRYRLCEMGIDIPNGQLFGELGLIAPRNQRTQTVECIEDGDVLTAPYLQVRELYFQNPQFGFYFLRLTSERLFQNIDRLEQELVRKNQEIAAITPKPAEAVARLARVASLV